MYGMYRPLVFHQRTTVYKSLLTHIYNKISTLLAFSRRLYSLHTRYTHPFKKAFGLLPGHKLRHSFGHLPKLVEIQVAIVRDNVGASLVDVVNILDQHTAKTGGNLYLLRSKATNLRDTASRVNML